MRHEAWVSREWPSIAPAFHSTPLEPFDVSTESLKLGPLIVNHTSLTAMRFQRNSMMLRSWHADSLAAVVIIDGETRGLAGDRAFRNGSGGIHLLDLAQAADVESTATESLLTVVPRNVAEQRGLRVSDLHGAVLTGPAADMLGPHLLGIRRASEELAAVDGPKLAGTVLDLLGLAVGAAGWPTRVQTRMELLRVAAEQEIDGGLGSHWLTIANLCRRLGVSRSTLHRAFEGEGGVQAFIRRRRLDAARSALADPTNGEPLYALAERLGFSDSAHLSRLFRAQFGLSPKEFRRQSREKRG